MKIYVDDELLIELSPTDILCLRNDLLSIKRWLRGAIVGIVSKRKKLMVREWQAKLFNDSTVKSIPANIDDLIALVVLRDDYMDRVARDKDAERLLMEKLEAKVDVGIS